MVLVLRLVGPESTYCDRVRQKVGSATLISVWHLIHKETNKQTSLLGKEASWTKRTDTPLTLIKRPSSKPSPWKDGSSNTQTASTNWTNQGRSFCSGWELGTTDLMSTCTASSRLASLRCAHAMQISWLQNIYCSTASYMMLWGRKCGQNQYHWRTSSMATWRSWGEQLLSWGRQASTASVRRKRRQLKQLSKLICQWNAFCMLLGFHASMQTTFWHHCSLHTQSSTTIIMSS